MVGHDQVRILRDEEVAVQHDASADERLHLLDERPGIDDDAATDDAAAAAMQDARRDRLEHVLLPSDDDGLAPVVAALVTDDHHSVSRGLVYDLPLPFVAPLRADAHNAP